MGENFKHYKHNAWHLHKYMAYTQLFRIYFKINHGHVFSHCFEYAMFLYTEFT